MEFNYNEKSSYKGRIVEVAYKVLSFSYLTQGIKKNDQSRYDQTMLGSNGTYTSLPIVTRHLYLKVVVYDYPENGVNSTELFDERDFILSFFKRSKVTEKFLSEIKEKLKGKKVSISFNDTVMIKENESNMKLNKEELKYFLSS